MSCLYLTSCISALYGVEITTSDSSSLSDEMMHLKCGSKIIIAYEFIRQMQITNASLTFLPTPMKLGVSVVSLSAANKGMQKQN